MSQKIKVKAAPDRVARVSPRGEMIPSDRFITVEATPYIMRLLNHHEDLIQEPQPPAPFAPASAKKE